MVNANPITPSSSSNLSDSLGSKVNASTVPSSPVSQPSSSPTKLKKKFNWKIILGAAALMLLLAGAAAAFFLSKQSQDIRQQAAVAVIDPGGGGSSCSDLGGTCKPSCNGEDENEGTSNYGCSAKCCIPKPVNPGTPNCPGGVGGFCGLGSDPNCGVGFEQSSAGGCNLKYSACCETVAMVCTPNQIQDGRTECAPTNQRKCVPNGSGWKCVPATDGGGDTDDNGNGGDGLICKNVPGLGDMVSGSRKIGTCSGNKIETLHVPKHIFYDVSGTCDAGKRAIYSCNNGIVETLCLTRKECGGGIKCNDPSIGGNCRISPCLDYEYENSLMSCDNIPGVTPGSKCCIIKCPDESTYNANTEKCECKSLIDGLTVSFAPNNILPNSCRVDTGGDSCEVGGVCVYQSSDCCNGGEVNTTQCAGGAMILCNEDPGTGGDDGGGGDTGGTGACNSGLPHGAYGMTCNGGYNCTLFNFLPSGMEGWGHKGDSFVNNRVITNPFGIGSFNGGQTVNFQGMMTDPNQCYYQFDFNNPGETSWQGTHAAVTFCYCPDVPSPIEPPVPPITPPPPPPSDQIACNSRCQTDSQCRDTSKGGDLKFSCINNRCRLTSNPSSAKCQPATGPMCLDITLNNETNPGQTPAITDNVNFTCGLVTGADHYIFRVFEPENENPLILSANANISGNYIVNAAGKYFAQCQICTAPGPDSCLPWEPITFNE